jgi:hypothetical protein
MNRSWLGNNTYLTNSIEQNPSWEADLLSWSKNILPFMESKVSLPYSQEISTGTYPKPVESSPHPYTLILISV